MSHGSPDVVRCCWEGRKAEKNIKQIANKSGAGNLAAASLGSLEEVKPDFFWATERKNSDDDKMTWGNESGVWGFYTGFDLHKI